MSSKIIIDPEFFAYLPRPSQEDFELIEKILLEEGIRDPLVVWKGHNILIDGHTRHMIAEKHGLPYTTIELHFETREEVKVWMSRNQLGRRNWATDMVRTYHLGVFWNSEKGGQGGRRDEHAATNKAEEIAKEAGVSVSTVKRSGKYAAEVDAAAEKAPEVREAMNKGKKISKKDLKAIAAAATNNEAKKLAKDAIDKPKEPKKKKADPEPEPEPLPENNVIDALGKKVLDTRYHEVFSDMDSFVKLLRNVKACEVAMKALSESAGGCAIDYDDLLRGAFRLIKSELTLKKPVCVCPKCKGEKTVEKDGRRIECDPCMGLGFLDQHHYDQKAKR